jgi:uncharacterized protein
MIRYSEKTILSDLEEKMVFIGGPRQVGKTYFSKELSKNHYNSPLYLNWDIDSNRKAILKLQFSPDHDIIIFDEIHKYENWKNHMKGVFDSDSDQKIIVTGSARLDLYRKGGDSMMGRYHYHRLHPISFAEKTGCYRKFDADLFEDGFKLKFQNFKNYQLEELMEFGGFPEPFMKQNKRFLKRWQNERKTRLVREDIRDVETIRHISILQILVDLLPSKVGSVFSINSLREDLRVSHQTIAKWLDILENFYYCYRIYPFNSSEIRSLKKEPKLFLWDYSEIMDQSIRFENLIGSHLLKFAHFLYDSYGTRIKLKYLRDSSKREVDFLLTVDDRPIIAVEVKLSNTKIPTSLKYFKTKLNIPFVYQVILDDGIDFQSPENGIRVISANKFLSALV